MATALAEGNVACVAVVQCDVALERCSGAACAISFTGRKHHFDTYGQEVIYVPFSCGGCPGRRASRLVSQLLRKLKKVDVGPERVVTHLAACVVNDNVHAPPCPHIDYMKRVLERSGLRVVEGSHISSTAERRRSEGRYESRG